MTVLFYAPPLCTQIRTIDSLQQALQKPMHDTMRVLLLNELAFEFYASAPITMERYAREALQLSQSTKFTRGVSLSYLHLGISLLQQSRYGEAENCSLIGLDIALKNNDNSNAGRAYNVLANINERQGNHAKAFEYFFKTLRLYESIGDTRTYPNLIGIGEIYRQQQLYDSAMVYYGKALQAWDKETTTKHRQQAPILLAYLGMGKVSSERGNYDEALQYLNQVVGAARAEGSKRRLVQGLCELGDVYQRRGEFRRALDTLSLALRLSNELGSPDVSADILRNFASAYKLAHEYAKSIEFAYRSLDTSRRYNIKKAASDAAYLLYTLYQEMNDAHNALRYHELASVYKDSLLSEQRFNQRAILEIGYQLDKKESENMTLQKDKSKQEQTLFIVLLGLGCLIVISIILVRVILQRRRLYSKLETAKNQIDSALHNVSILSEIGLEISSTLDFERILGTLYKRVNELMDASIFAIGIYNHEERVLDYALTIIDGQHLPPYQRDLRDKNQFAVWSLDHKKEVFINDVDVEYKQYISSFREKVLPPTASSAHEHTEVNNSATYPRSLVFVPLLVQDRVVGVLSTATRAKNAYTYQHLDVLRSIATVAATAIDNASAYRHIIHQRQMLEHQAREIELSNTELQENLETLRQTQAQLLQAEKMASLGTLVAGVAHELNTPIGVAVTAASTLHGNVENFEKEYQTGGLKKSSLENFIEHSKLGAELTLRNLERAADLVQSFKQVAVDQTSDAKRRFKLDEYLHEIITSLQPKLKTTKHRVAIECDETLELETYPGAIAQIITNFITNSLLHGFDGYTENGVITIACKKVASSVTLTYSDNGRGIPPEVLPRIFDPFFTTKQAQGGTGLGMHIVYNLATQKLGGSIRFEPNSGSGARFIVEFPCS